MSNQSQISYEAYEAYEAFIDMRNVSLYTTAFTYYYMYDPAILQNNLTSLSIFRDLVLRKGDSKKFIFYFYVFYRVYTSIPKLFGFVVYPFMDFLGDNISCARIGTKIQ